MQPCVTSFRMTMSPSDEWTDPHLTAGDYDLDQLHILMLCKILDSGFRRQFVSEVDVIRPVSGPHSAPLSLSSERFVVSQFIALHLPSSSGGRGQGEGAYAETRGPADWRSDEPR